MRFSSTILALAMLAPLQSAEDYEIIEPPSEVLTDLRVSFSLIASHIVQIGPLKPHPKITWLDQSNQRILNGEPTEDGKIQTELGFVVRSPGTVKFPPIPIVIENDSFLLRLPSIRAIKNRSPKDFAQFDVLWNEDTKIPEVVHLGETIEIDYIGRVISKQSAFLGFETPTSRAENARWHLFTRRRGQNARSEDYFYGISSRGFSFGYGSSYRRYAGGDTELRNQHARFRRYRARMICSKLGEVSGHLGMTMSSGTDQRTFLKPFKFQVIPLPALPNDNVIDTGLIGNWEINTRISPSRIATNKPIELTMLMSGKGDPSRRKDFDFSRDGFPSVDRQPAQERAPNYLTWDGRFQQTLVPTGKVPTFQAITLASFDTTNDRWKLHHVTPALTLTGMTDITDSLTPATALGNPIQRPVLLNLPPATFGAFAIAPFLPLLLRLIKKRLDQRDPERKERKQKARAFIATAQNGSGKIEDDLLPVLREHLKLPPGSSTGEVAEALESSGHSDLAETLRAHAEFSFSSSAPPVDFKKLAQQLAKIAFIFLLFLPQLRAATLESANAAYGENRYSEAIAEYQTLIEKNPGQAVLHRNLALAYLAVDDPARARAACHTALLLSPLDGETRVLMNDIRTRLNAPTLPGTRLLELRPDQWLVLATAVWIFGFLLIGLRYFYPRIPTWTSWAVFALALLFIATGIWRNQNAYQEGQFMVLGKDVPREPKIGNPNWDFPPLHGGQIVLIDETTKTHARIKTSGTPFWIPLSELKQVW
ncbi:MAG: tetratricopeptide repeat protein [Akkermansiaceae bacterium]